MEKDVCSLLVSLLVLCSPLTKSCDSAIPSDFLENYLCGDGPQREVIEFQLATNVTHYIKPGNFCVVQNLVNVTISSDIPGKQAIIVCNHTAGFSFFTTRGFGFLNCSNLTLKDLSFSQCGGVVSPGAFLYENSTNVPTFFGTNQSAVMFFSETLNLRLINITVTRYYGFAIIAANSYGSPSFYGLHIIDSSGGPLCAKLNHTHKNYTCYGSGVLIYTHNSDLTALYNYSNNNLTISDSLFQRNSYFTKDYVCMHNVFQFYPERIPLSGAGGITMFFTQSRFVYTTVINHTVITENNGTIVGGLFAAFINSPYNSFLVITGQTTISKNTMLIPFCPGSGFASYIYFTQSYIESFQFDHLSDMLEWTPLIIHNTDWTPLTIRNTLITNHTSNGSSTVHIVMLNQPLFDIMIALESVNFTYNGAFYNGICMYAETAYSLSRLNVKLLSLIMTNVVVEHNSQYFGNFTVNTVTNSSQFLFTRLGRVTIKGTPSHGSSFISNYGSVIDAFSTDIYITGKVTFQDNKASYGAAILLESNSHIILAENSTILFQNNIAFLDGGAIYAYERSTANYVCVIQVDSNKRSISDLKINVTFDSNRAYRSGPATYAAPLQHCFQMRFRVFPHQLTNLYDYIFTFVGNNTPAFTSPSIGICACINDTPDCSKKFATHSIYPGDSITVSLIAIDSIGGSVFSQMNASFSSPNSTIMALPGWWINTNQEISTLYNGQCRNLTYTVHSYQQEGTGRLNFAAPGLPPQAYQNVSLKTCPPGFRLNEEMGSCECRSFLSTINIGCDRSSKKVYALRPLNWIGLIRNSSVADEHIGFAPFCPTTYCNSSSSLNVTIRNTSLCLNNRAGVLCGECQPGYSITLGPHMCMVCSNYWLFTIVLYLGGGLLAVLLMFVFKLTLHLGTIGGLIFYANIFAVTYLIPSQTFLIPFTEPVILLNLDQAFPSCFFNGMTMSVKMGLQYAYAFYLWLLVFVVLLITRYSSQATRFLLKSSVQVLMTLIHLSFSRMLITDIEVFSSSTIITEDREYLVWLADGSVLFGKKIGHALLLVIATLAAALVIFPYLLLGTLGSFGLRYRWVNKLRPFIDAIHGPYKDDRRYWFGMRLILLVTVYITYAIMRGRYPQEQVLLTLVLLATFTIVQAYIRPFQKDLVGILDTWLMFNTIFLVCINLYNELGGKNAIYLLLANLILVLCTALVVVIGHTVMLVKHMKVKLKPFPNLINHTAKPMATTSAEVTVSVVSTSQDIHSSKSYQSIQNSYDRYDKLREPVLEQCD